MWWPQSQLKPTVFVGAIGMPRGYLRENACQREDMWRAWQVGRVSSQMLAGRRAQLCRRASARCQAFCRCPNREERGVVGLGNHLGYVLLNRRQHLGNNVAGGLRQPVGPELHRGMQPRPERLEAPHLGVGEWPKALRALAQRCVAHQRCREVRRRANVRRRAHDIGLWLDPKAAQAGRESGLGCCTIVAWRDARYLVNCSQYHVPV